MVSGFVMKKLSLRLRITFIFSSLFLSFHANAQDHFTIKDKQALSQYGQKEEKESATLKSFKNGVVSKSLSTSSLHLGNENPIFREVTQYFNEHSNAIASEQIDEIRESGGLQAWGGLNHIGLSFSKGFGNFSVELRRDVAPDLFSDDLWIATDQFDLYISATHLLGNLRDEEIIDITDEQLGLFAGVTFKRSYTYVHYEESYEKALAYNLDKLFFSYLNFRSENYLQIERGELLKKEDSISLAVGAAGNASIGTGLAAHVGALVKYNKLSYVTLQGVSADEVNYQGEWLRIASEKSSTLSAGVSAGVVADFLGVLQVSLLKYDFNYSLKESYSFALSFDDTDRDILANQSSLGREVASVLKQEEADERALAPYIVSHEQRKELAKDSRYQLLLFGGKKKAKTTHYKITKEDHLHSFFSHNFESGSYRQNIFSKLFGIVLKSFLDLKSIISNSEERSRAVTIQYKNKTNLIESKKDLLYQEDDSEEKLSLNFIRNYYAYKGSRNNREELVEYLEKYSGVDPLVIDQVESGLLDKSLRFYSKYSMTKDGIDYFNHLNPEEVYKIFDRICDSSRPRGFFGWLSSLFSSCERKLKSQYDLYQIELSSNALDAKMYKRCESDMKSYSRRRGYLSSSRKRKYMNSCLQRLAQKSQSQRDRELPVWRMAKFMDHFLNKAESKVYYFQLFGVANVHVYGQVSGTTHSEQSFIHHFSEGNFKGIDLISNFQKNNGLKTSLEVK